VRFPLVHGVTDDDENVEAIGRLVRSLGLPAVDVLPYHRAGLSKYARLGVEYRLPDARPPSSAAVAAIVERLAACNLDVRAQ